MKAAIKKISLAVIFLGLGACANQPVAQLNVSVEDMKAADIERSLIGSWNCSITEEGDENMKMDYLLDINKDYSFTVKGKMEFLEEGESASFSLEDKGTWSLNDKKQMLSKSAGFTPMQNEGEETEFSKFISAMLNGLMPLMLEKIDYTSTSKLVSLDQNKLILNDITPVMGETSDTEVVCTR